MRQDFSIITVGLWPSWDMVCKLKGLQWGQHKLVDFCSNQPAGKAFNLSRALAWLGQKNIAAGLWGQQDYEKMLAAAGPMKKVKIMMTPVAGATRQNVTIVDTAKAREMHLRNKSELVSKKNLAELKRDLGKIVTKNSVCVFAGSMLDEKLLNDIYSVVSFCRKRAYKIVLDTYGKALRKFVDSGIIWLIKPNVEELRELLGKNIKDDINSLVKAGRSLLDRVEVVLISRGEKGAVLVTKNGTWHGKCLQKKKSVHTVGCGDYLLAGFLKSLREKHDYSFALQTAIKVATARAWGLTEQMSWLKAGHKIRTAVTPTYT